MELPEGGLSVTVRVDGMETALDLAKRTAEAIETAKSLADDLAEMLSSLEVNVE